MSLNKAIESGKERRKPYRKSKAFDYSCRNHGSCGYCYNARTYFDRKVRMASLNDLDVYQKSLVQGW